MVLLIRAFQVGINYKPFIFTFVSMLILPITFFFISRGKKVIYNNKK